jgi:hypothetical protein
VKQSAQVKQARSEKTAVKQADCAISFFLRGRQNNVVSNDFKNLNYGFFVRCTLSLLPGQ